MAKCEFYIEHKQRQCGMTCREGMNRCVAHSETPTKRVPCPLDPNHTVWEASLQKHLRKCNKLKQRHLNDDQDFYQEDLNTGGLGTFQPVDDSTQDVLETIPLVEKIYEQFEELVLDQRSNSCMDSSRMLQLPSNKKHALQQSSLIQHMVDGEMFGPNRTFIEFGCGRAELSRYVNQVALLRGDLDESELPKFLLIDRGSNRMKFDKKFGDDSWEISRVAHGRERTKRCRIDIKDLKLSALVEDSRQHVAISKHLCGVATDLTLRCLERSSLDHETLKGVCIAMCCRHCCDAQEYINPEFLKLQLSQNDSGMDYLRFFKSLMKMCSWATCGRRPGMQDDDIGGHFTGLSVIKREELGFMARRIIDEGRAQWIRKKGFNVSLVKYVEQGISLENVALVVKPK